MKANGYGVTEKTVPDSLGRTEEDHEDLFDDNQYSGLTLTRDLSKAKQEC
jgi:hypothetical protein